MTTEAPPTGRQEKTREIERRTYDRIRVAVELAMFVAGFVALYITMDRRLGAAEATTAQHAQALRRLEAVPESLAELRAEQRGTTAAVARIERVVEQLAARGR